MTKNEVTDFIFGLAGKLKGNRVDEKIIIDALELLCEKYGFSRGVVYENMASSLCPVENWGRGDAETKEIPFSDELKNNLIGNDFYSIENDEKNEEFEKTLLDLFAANSLFFASVTDGSGFLYGFLLLINENGKKENDEELSTAAAMLIRYISARMYRTRTEQSMSMVQKLLDNTGVDVYVNDYYTHDILYVNKSMAEPYGGKEVFAGQKCWNVLFPNQSGPCEFCPKDKIVDENGRPSGVYSWDYKRAFDGSWFRVFSSAFYWEGGRLAHIISSADITDNKRNEAIIENMANFDQLTKLPNRRMLLKECRRRIENATRNECGYTMFFDIDGFKLINDTFGHDAGDEFLIELGEFFSKIPMLKNSIYRNGGDEFVAVLGGENINKSHVNSLAGFIHRRFAETWQLKSGSVTCGVSIGVACYPEDGTTGEDLIQKADQAMYKVKKAGGNGICFAQELK